MRTARGFTLVELLVAIAILVVLVSIAIAFFGDAIRKSYRASALANARVCLSEYSASTVENDPYTPPAGCTLSADGSSCTCTVSGLVGSVTCTLGDGGSVSCQ
ncbi:MAG: type II secretion system protein [Aquificaceae bacterium]|jgi:prepilin-type N-terminal cleavage/methylation domain-containing protein|uniref:type II secretion system protein n=1 Tax=Hydrogenobacter sp. Uz 6-8 TaxID=3384828 RepID=UPI000F234201|nr:MAG: type II secretion system protein [Aquificota bacterium]